MDKRSQSPGRFMDSNRPGAEAGKKKNKGIFLNSTLLFFDS